MLLLMDGGGGRWLLWRLRNGGDGDRKCSCIGCSKGFEGNIHGGGICSEGCQC